MHLNTNSLSLSNARRSANSIVQLFVEEFQNQNRFSTFLFQGMSLNYVFIYLKNTYLKLILSSLMKISKTALSTSLMLFQIKFLGFIKKNMINATSFIFTPS